jgi:hypothetical protein
MDIENLDLVCGRCSQSLYGELNFYDRSEWCDSDEPPFGLHLVVYPCLQCIDSLEKDKDSAYLKGYEKGSAGSEALAIKIDELRQKFAIANNT